MADQAFPKGLEGVIATDSKICRVDGINGKLYYRGYSIQDLAANSTFEETTYLLIYGRLPSESQLAEFEESMRDSRELNHTILNMIRDFPAQGSPMELLQSVISYLSSSLVHKIEHNATCDCRNTLHQIAQITTVLATYQRFREGKEYLHSRKDLSHGANFLYLLRGEEPTEEEGRIMDICMILHAEHGLNASTFTARVVASSLASCYSSISAAIGSLSGSLHGGANEKLMDMVDEIGSIDNVDAWLDQALAEKRKVMGMGHRVYRTKDPRSIVMEEMFQKLAEERGERQLFDLLKALETSFRERMEEKGKPIYPNVDFFSGAMYTLLGIERDLFTPIFAASRAPGWLAHILEQRQDNRIYRPSSLFVGPEPRSYVPIDQRG
ncbi:MAG: citrate/2-methylcitrate synthase [Planctomycetes bacterium]|nr:citrate/2-methylcitrate synthase [Planctomycetota bacterium]